MSLGHDLFVILQAVTPLEKEASKWKRMLGELGTDDVKRLLDEGVLDYGKEITGLNKGTENILRSLGAEESEASLRALIASLKSSIRQGSTKPLAEGVKDFGMASMGGGGAASPIMRKIYIRENIPFLKGLSGQDMDAAKAVVRRHEADELRSAARAGFDPRTFVPGKKAQTLSEKITARAARLSEKGIDKYVTDPIQHYSMKKTMKAMLPKSTRSDVVATGKHMSPDVILNESANLQALPPNVTKQMRSVRAGEQETLGPYGFEFGKTPDAKIRRKVRKAWLRDEV